MSSVLTPAPLAAPPAPRLALSGLLLGATVALLWLVLVRQLSFEWSANEQYSYGWFVPLLAAFLFWLRWGTRPNPIPPSPSAQWRIALLSLLPAFLALAGARLCEPANPDWRPLDWIHAACVAAVTLYLLWSLGRTSWLRHFAFPVLFFFVAVPWISPIEQPIVGGLMKVVAASSAEIAQLCGIPAQLNGNLIRINHDLLDVEEACSGIRSFQTAIMIGLLFGELKRLSTARRCWLLLFCVASALLANLGRTLFLVAIAASRGTEQVGQWHDLAGYAILGLVFLASLGAAEILGRREPERAATRPRTRSAKRLSLGLLAAMLIALGVIELGVETWYRVREDRSARIYWEVAWPREATAYREPPLSPLVRGLLRFDQGKDAIWRDHVAGAPNDMGATFSCYLFAFHWNARSPNLLLARSYRPDICLPNSGWDLQADLGTRLYPTEKGIALPFRHYRFALERAGSAPSPIADAFFCSGEDWIRRHDQTNEQFYLQRAKPTKSGFIQDRFHAVWHGLRNNGAAVLEVILIGPSDLDSARAEHEFARTFAHLVRPCPRPIE